MRPVGMARDLHLLPGRQRLVDVAQRVPERFSSRRDLIADIDRLAVLGELLQLEDLAFEIGDRLFEIEIIVHS